MTGFMRHGLGDCTPAPHCGCLATRPSAVEAVPARHETPDVAELRRLAEACPMPDNDPSVLSEWYEFEDLTERNHPLPPIDAAASPAVVMGLLDRLDALGGEGK